MKKDFFTALADFTARFDDIGAAESSLIPLREELVRGLRGTAETGRLADANELGKLAQEVGRSVVRTVEGIVADWEAAAPMRELSTLFGDRVIVLVFGKVNGGKSSFGNFVASQFPPEETQFFYLEDGRPVDTDAPFAEGATETTSRIQGVRLGQRLVLLDSPGLHSVTGANGDLTRLFTDSADVVLWVTSSVAPGQVQELDDLQDEIARGKPLLPVITKSDVNVEDEVDGAIVSVRQLKAPARRAEQENDVLTRARAKLGDRAGSLLAPVSVSVRYCRENKVGAGHFADSGMDRLFAQLAERIRDAQGYKAQKAARQVLNYLDKKVLGAVHAHLLPGIADLSRQAGEQVKLLEKERHVVVQKVLTDVLAALPTLIQGTQEKRDLTTLRLAIGNVLNDSLNNHLQEALSPYLKSIDDVLLDLSGADIGTFTENSYDVKTVSGKGSRAAAVGAGSLIGVAIGTLLPIPIAGSIAGGAIGGWIGGKLGENLVEESWETRVVGVTSEQILAHVEKLLQKLVPQEVGRVIDNCTRSISLLQKHATQLGQHITHFENRLNEAKEALNEQPV